jgi:hypothetical protein
MKTDLNALVANWRLTAERRIRASKRNPDKETGRKMVSTAFVLQACAYEVEQVIKWHPVKVLSGRWG